MHPTSKALFNVIQAWRAFKESHNLDDPKVKCCEKTEALFIALQLFDEAIEDDIDEQLSNGGNK